MQSLRLAALIALVTAGWLALAKSQQDEVASFPKEATVVKHPEGKAGTEFPFDLAVSNLVEGLPLVDVSVFINGKLAIECAADAAGS